MRALFLGGHTFDTVYRLDALPTENAKAKADGVYTAAGGPALNAAITCAILASAACEVVFAGALGDGPLTDAVSAEAEEYGVRLHKLGARREDAPCASIALTPGGMRTIWSPPQAETPEGALDDLPDPQGFDVLLVDGQLPEAAVTAARAFKEAGKSVVLDAGSWKPGMEALTGLASDIIASSAFAFPKGGDALERALEAGAQAAAVTSDGAAIRWRTADGGKGAITPPAVDALDTLAAGDIFHGAYVWFRYGAGLSFDQVLDQAARVASSSVAHYGPRAGVVAARG
jgi:sugar/nucleoside kinase (ribokinase family)